MDRDATSVVAGRTMESCCRSRDLRFFGPGTMGANAVRPLGAMAWIMQMRFAGEVRTPGEREAEASRRRDCQPPRQLELSGSFNSPGAALPPHLGSRLRSTRVSLALSPYLPALIGAYLTNSVRVGVRFRSFRARTGGCVLAPYATPIISPPNSPFFLSALRSGLMSG